MIFQGLHMKNTFLANSDAFPAMFTDVQSPVEIN